MTKVKVKTKKNVEKVVTNTVKVIFSSAFVATWLYVVYHMIFIY